LKKKTKIIIILLLLILFTPIPMGVYKDGGTRVYGAVTYKIVDWNHFYGERAEIYSKTRIYPFPLNFRSLDSLWSIEENRYDLR